MQKVLIESQFLKSSSSAWAMTCNPPDQNYAQVGWAKDPGFTALKYFWEYNSVVTSKFG